MKEKKNYPERGRIFEKIGHPLVLSSDTNNGVSQ